MSGVIFMVNLRKEAEGRECQARIPGVCNWKSETTVGGHLNGAGTGLKHHDIFLAWTCFACHAWFDGGYVKTSTREERDLWHLQAIFRTQQILIAEKKIIVGDG